MSREAIIGIIIFTMILGGMVFYMGYNTLMINYDFCKLVSVDIYQCMSEGFVRAMS